MKKYFGIIFSVIIVIFSLLLIFLPKVTFSEDENRILSTFPEFNLKNIETGKFMTDIENYIKDHFAFRKFFLDLKAKAELNIGKDENNDVYVCKNNYLIKKTEKPNTDFYLKAVKVINRFAKNENVKNLNISLMIAPTSVSINSDLLPKNAENYSEKENIDYIYNNISKLNPNISLIDVYSSLENSKAEGIYDLYFRLDHHWTANGAYSAYKSYLKSLNEEPLKLDEFNKKTVTTDFNGTLYSEGNIYFLPSDKIDVYSHKKNTFRVNIPNQNKTYDSFFNYELLKTKSKYDYFLGGNFDIVTIQNIDSKSDKNLLIIKDSYANIFVPFISNNFKNTHLIDLRYFKSGTVSEYVNKNNITHILFLFNIRTIETSDLLKLK